MSNQNNRSAAKIATKPEARKVNRRSVLLGGNTLAAASTLSAGAPITLPQAQQLPAPSGSKPNILMIMTDDIGWFNVSTYNHGIMGDRMPNIDPIAREGAMLTGWYGEKGSAFITGQSPIRTGLTKVGLPGAES
jgi:hypothetical protein